VFDIFVVVPYKSLSNEIFIANIFLGEKYCNGKKAEYLKI
jgi:hypothetical protein